MTIDAIIPIYKLDQGLFRRVERLENQMVPVQKIVLTNTEKKTQ